MRLIIAIDLLSNQDEQQMRIGEITGFTKLKLRNNSAQGILSMMHAEKKYSKWNQNTNWFGINRQSYNATAGVSAGGKFEYFLAFTKYIKERLIEEEATEESLHGAINDN